MNLSNIYKLVLVCLSSFIFSFSLQISADEELSRSELITLLQQGGYVIYLRHGATDHTQSDENLSDLRECSKQRNLSQLGKVQSRSLGRAFDAFGIKLDRIDSSPYCRCVDTALYAFNRVNIDENMRATFASDRIDTEQVNQHLSKRLTIHPIDGHNNLLVGHTANLRDVTKVWPKPEGVIHIFRPLGEKGYQHMGSIAPSTWDETVSKQNQ